jgi:DNA-binding winged helix-turn-helix (wHTH) protein
MRGINAIAFRSDSSLEASESHPSNINPEPAVQPSNRQAWRIGSHELRSDGSFWHGSDYVALSPLQRSLLLCFCRHAGQLIQREQLALEVWQSVDVSDQSLARAVHNLRRTLEKCGIGGDRINTIYGSGFIFTAEVSPQQHAAPMAVPVHRQAARLAHEHLLEGLTLIAQRHPAGLHGAMDHVRQAIALNPHHPSARLELGWLLLARGLWGLAPSATCAQEIQQLLQTIPPVGEESQDQERTRLALDSLALLNGPGGDRGQPIELQPEAERGETLWSLARQALLQGEPQQALKLLTPHLDPRLPGGWFLAAVAHLQQGNPDAALTDLHQLQSLRPQCTTTPLALAVVLAHTNRPVTALQQLSLAGWPENPGLSQGPLSPWAAYVLARSDQTEAARQVLGNADLAPATSGASAWALVALALNDTPTIQAWCQRAHQDPCPLAPYLLQSALMAPYLQRPEIRRWQAATTLPILALAA